MYAGKVIGFKADLRLILTENKIDICAEEISNHPISCIRELPDFMDVLAKLFTLRKSMFDSLQQILKDKHSVSKALGIDSAGVAMNPRCYWARSSYYTPPRNESPALHIHLFDHIPPPAILPKLLSVLYEEEQALNAMYKDCVFDENGWTFSIDHWYNSITNSRSESSPYELSDDDDSKE